MYESRPGIELYYFYDSYGNLTSIRYLEEGATTEYSYYVTTNIQGDVLGIYTSQGIQVAAYEYDAWGNCTVYDVTQDSAGNNVFTEVTYSDSPKFNMEFLNPFRYRGYYYDQDMGLYYLQSRYYDPQVGRFVNADSESLVVSTPLNLTDKNLFDYCDNNPIVRADNCGDYWVLIGAFVGAVVSSSVSAVSQYLDTGEVNWGVVGVNAVSGAISGALASTGIGLGASIGINAALGGLTYAAEQKVKHEEITLGGVAASTISGGIGGAIGGKGTNAKGLSSTWKNASKGIIREQRRQNTKYATKQIARYSAEKVAVKNTAKTSVIRLILGTIGNTLSRWRMGY